MNKLKYFSVAITIVLAACKPEIKGELGEPFSKTEGLSGNWQLVSFSQRDENNPIKEVRNLSDFYVIPGEESTKISFNSSDFSYSVIPGSGRNFFGTEGTWKFDNNDAPSFLYLQNITDTLELKLGSMPRSFDQQLDVELPRYCVDNAGVATPTVTYIFTIQRIN